MPTCVHCASDEFSAVYRDERLEVIRCRGCGLVRQADYAAALRKRDRAVADVEEYYRQRRHTVVTTPAFRAAKLRRTADVRGELRRRLDGDARVLDVGCGAGDFAAALRDLGLDVVGLEPNRATAEEARSTHRLEVVAAPYERGLFAADGFAAITLIQVLEHMEDPARIVRCAHHHLAPGGLLVVDVPSFHNPRLLLYRLLRWRPLARRDFIVSHNYYFTRATLTRLVAAAGFDVLRAQTGRYAVKFGNRPLVRGVLKAVDAVADRLGVGGITLYARKRSAGAGDVPGGGAT